MAGIILLAGCGRRQSHVADDGGVGYDGFVYDTGTPWEAGSPDGSPDGPPPCVPDCAKICAMQANCGLIPASGVAECEKQCKANPGTPELVCLGQLACAASPDCAAAKKCKADPKAPDLTVSHSATSPSSGQIAYTAKVCNVGTGAASGFTVHMYNNNSNPPVTGQKGDHIVKVSSLGPNTCKSVTASSTGLAAGAYNTWAQVDTESAIVETDETNNVSGPVAVKVADTKPQKPDLVVSNLLVQVSSSAGTAKYTATVCNNGLGAAAGTSLDIYVDSASSPSLKQAGDTSLTVSSLAAGACTSLTWSTKLTSGKTYSSWATVDRLNTIAESGEANNRYGPVKFTVGGTTKLPDLVVTSMTVTAGKTSGAFKISVCNQGTAASGKTSYLRLYANLTAAPTKNTKYTKIIGIASLAASACKALTWSVSAKPGSYKSWAAIDMEGLIKENVESNNTYGPVTWTVAGTTQKPDITVIAMTAQANAAGTVSYTATVCNKGKGSTGKGFAIGWYTNRSTAPTTSSTPDGTGTFTAALGPGDCKTVSWFKSLKAGTYASWVLADQKNAIAETGEGNNYYGPVKVTVAGTSPQPDLYIASMKATPSGGTITYHYYQVSVCNKGNAMSSYATLELYLNRSSKPGSGTAGNYTTTVTNLAPGTCQNRNFSLVLSPGTYKSWAYVDRSNVIKESNETNNIYGPLTVKVAGTGKPDLQVINVSTSTNATGYTYYYMTVCNKGTAVAGNARIDLYYNLSKAPDGKTPGNHSTYVGALNAGACTTRTGYTTLPGGTYKSWVYVDRENVVFESNEGNNTYGPVTVKVSGTGKSDLQITNVSTSPYSSGYTMYYVTVCNKGTAPAGYARIDLYYNRSTKPAVTDVGERYTNTTTLQAGACTTRNIYATLGPGTYNSWLWVDRINSVIESNEGNNIYGPVKVTVGSTSTADLYVSALKTTTSSSGATTYYITVCNAGLSTASSTTVDLYYNRSYTPSQWTAGDKVYSVKSLAAKACTTVTASASLKSGTYTSWARVDRSNKVKETNEYNNVHGPVTVIVGSTSNLCTTVCSVLVNPCKYLQPSQVGMCLAMCQAQSKAKQQCAYKQALAKNCTAIIQCL